MKKSRMGVAIVLNVTLILLLFTVLYFLYNPQPIADHLMHTYGGTSSDLSLSIEQEFEGFKYFTRGKGSRAILVIPGGAFVRTLIDFTPFDAFYEDYTVIITTYPIRFECSVDKAIRHLQQLVQHLSTVYSKLTLLGYSAGAYIGTKAIYATTYVDSFIGLNGYYGYTSIDDPFIQMTDFLYIREGPSQPLNIPTLFTHSTQDILKDSSIAYAQLCGSKSKQFVGGHLLLYDLKHNKSLIQTMLQFLKNLDA